MPVEVVVGIFGFGKVEVEVENWNVCTAVSGSFTLAGELNLKSKLEAEL